MKRSIRLVALAGGLVALNVAPNAVGSCGSTFCAINTNWDTHGAWSQPGWRLDLRYESIQQNRLQEGRRRVAIGEIPRDHDEVETVNRNWLASVDYTFNADWGVSVALPMVKRRHSHIHNHEDGDQDPESWEFSRAGDARVLARYRIGTFEYAGQRLGTLGLNFGLKLATGRFDVQNADGVLAERTLQPGSGTTDALLGAYYAQVLPLKDLSWFAQGLLQVPFNSREGFKPGRKLSLDAGLRYDATERVSLMLQINALHKARDSGANAEPEDSGGRSLFIGPGASFAATKDIRVYGFLQVPIAQRVNGVQLVARRAVVLGVNARF